MAQEATTAAAISVAPRLQAGLDQLEAGIIRAHELLDETIPRNEEQPTTEPAPSAQDALLRCQGKVAALNARLELVVQAVGRLSPRLRCGQT